MPTDTDFPSLIEAAVEAEKGRRDAYLCLASLRASWASTNFTPFQSEEAMKAHCIELLLEDGANNATLRINEGTWVLTKESGTLVQVDDGNVQIMQSLTEIEIRLPPGCRPARPPRVTVHALTGSEFFDGELSRDKTGSEGRIGVRSPEGDETDYLLQGQHCRRVTLPFSPASRRSNCE